tara:strand:+ start:648 stop:2147 length:1500 start_codon:yes stop_codon:yes gene_type:complete
MITNSQGDKGFYRNKHTSQLCEPVNGVYDTRECYFDTVIRGTAVGGYGQKIHTLKQESGTSTLGLPDSKNQMWKHYDLQNKCDTNDLNTCNDNANCIIQKNFFINEGDTDNKANELKVKNTLREMRATHTPQQKDYWKDKWTDDKNVCDWEGISCDTVYDINKSNNTKYISNIDVPPQYLNKKPSYCGSIDPNLTQNNWVSKQSQECSKYEIDRACSDNKFCKWKDESERCWKTNPDGTEVPTQLSKDVCEKTENHNWKIGVQDIKSKYKSKYKYYEHFYESDKVNRGTCSLDTKYKQLSGLNKDDEFKKKTMSDILGEINNGRVSDANVTTNVTHTYKGDVLMQQDNQETAVKGVIEESALSNIYLSDVNTKIIQQSIRYKVYQKTKLIIDYQSPEALYIIMRSIMLQHGNFKVSTKDLAEEIRKLNYLALKYSVEKVTSNVLQYKHYIKDLEHLPVPLDRPGYTSRAWNKPYDLSARNDLHSEHTYTMRGITHTYQD